MSWNNRIIWSEGMFLRPQHFQQFGRNLESQINGICSGLRNHQWGIQELQLDTAALNLGKIAIIKLRGRLPDGTYINIPEDDDPPLPLDVPENTNESIVYITLPLHRREASEVDTTDNHESLARYLPQDYEVRSNITGADETARISVGKLRLRIMLENEDRSAYASLGVARITEIRSDKHVELDESYIPPALDCHANSRLHGYIKEIAGMLHQRGDALAARVSDAGRGGVAEIADFMLLQAVNRYEPMFNHLLTTPDVHPEFLYQCVATLAGELATFNPKSRRPRAIEPYEHDKLLHSFNPIMIDVRQALGAVLEQTAVGLPLQAHQYGIHVSTISDRTLLGKAFFVLAVRAQVPSNELATKFPAQCKIGPADQIRQLVNMGLPGIGLRTLPVAPRQIPFHAGFTYFELDRSSEFWKQLPNAGAFAFHIGGNFPGLEMEFWAIKE